MGSLQRTRCVLGLLLMCTCEKLMVFAQYQFELPAGYNEEHIVQREVTLRPEPEEKSDIGGPCRNGRHCRSGLCCLLDRDHGKTCQPLAKVGEQCGEFQVKGGAYADFCPCLEGLGKPDCLQGTSRRSRSAASAKMGAYASIATPLHVIYDLRDSLPAGSLMILAPLVLSLIMNRRRSSQESSRPPSPMASCTFVTPFRYDVRRSRSRTEEHAPTGQPGSPPSLEPGWRRPSMSEPEPEFPFLVDCPPAENTAPLTPSHEEEFDDTRKTQRCPLNKFDRFRPKRNKEELAYARSSENHRPSDRRMEKLPHSAPARERLASCGGGEDSALPSADAGGNGIAGRRQLCGVSASQESIEIARRLYDDDDCGLASDLSWNSFDVSEDSQQSGRPDSVLWETRKSHFPKLMSAVLSEPHADDESDARGDCGLVPGERCMSVDEEPELGTTTEIFGDRRFDELLQLCGQEKAATFSDLLQELGVQKCLKLREAEGEEVFCVDAGRGGGTALLTVLHGDIAIRRGKHTLQDDIRARAGSSPETFTNGTSKESGSGDFLEYYCVRDKYSEVLVKACINYFNLKGCTTFGDDQRRMIRPYIVVVKPIPDVASSYL